jgi:peptidoglycan hydrolase CwlO-like protein
MIDKKISLGTILTGMTIIGTFIFTQGSTQTKIISVEKEQTNTIKRVKNNEDNIVNLKISVGKIETQLDDRFDRLEEILMDLE